MSTTTGIQVTFPGDRHPSGRHWTQMDVSELRDERVPAPKYRHAAPSAPWPWMDFTQDKADVRPLPPLAGAFDPWTRYPQSHFGNWTQDQVNRSRMLTIGQERYPCQIHKVDILVGGEFGMSESTEITPDDSALHIFWDKLQRPLYQDYRVRALFVENMTLDVLKILGATYDIDPCFFASSANWIPSRYQENPMENQGDHITVILPFIRIVNNREGIISLTPSNQVTHLPEKGEAFLTDKNQTIDTQAPLVLSDEKILVQDLLAIHMVRSTSQNIIISYHHGSKLQKTTARHLQSLVQRTGNSVYWSKIFAKSEDPTFLLLAILWYALYAWDEAFEVLYCYINALESDALKYSDVKLMGELHKLQAHLLHYQQLLREFGESVEFVRDTPNPVMDSDLVPEDERMRSKELLKLESNALLSKILRLEKNRQVQSDRLQNATQLAMTVATMQNAASSKRDAASMKQIAYMTTLFLPATYLASVFGMHVAGIDATFAGYIGSTIFLTVLVAWVIVALDESSSFHPGGSNFMRRIGWPVYYGRDLISKVAYPRRRARTTDSYSV